MTVTTPAAMRSSARQAGFQERYGSPGEQRAGYADGTGGVPNAPPQGSYPAQQSSYSTSTKVSERVPYQGQKLRHREYVDEQGYVKKKKSRKVTLAQHAAAHVAVFLCCAWVCTAPLHCCCCV